MTRPSPTMEKLIAAITLGVAFLVLASVFRPLQTEAISSWPAPPMTSTDPHEGLISLGTIHDVDHTILVFAGPDGPRYTIYATDRDLELAILLTAEQVAARFPDLNLPVIDFSAGNAGPLMVVDPLSVQPH